VPFETDDVTGSTMITGKADIEKARLIALYTALRAEVLHGVQVTKGRSASARIKREFDMPMNLRKKETLTRFEAILRHRGLGHMIRT